MQFFKPKPKLLLALDINTSSARAAVFWAHKGAKPEVVKVFKSNAKFLEKGGFTELRRGIYGALDELLKRIHKESSPRKIEGVLISFSSPWYFAAPRIIEIGKQEETFELTEKLIEEKLRSEKELMKKELAQRFKVTEKDLLVLEASLMRSFLNGYGVKDIYGKKANSASMYVYVSAVFQEMTEDIKRKIFGVFGTADVHFHTAPFILFNKIRDNFKEEAFMIVEVGEEVTDVSLVRGGVIQEIASFARGSNFLTRHVASYFKIPLEEAVSYINMYSAGHLEAKAALKTRNIIEEGLREWKNFFEQVVGGFYETSFVPEKVFIFGPSVMLKYFADAASSRDLARFVFADLARVEQLKPETVKEEFFRGYGLKTHEETIISFLILFYNEHVWQTPESNFA
ncbi:MAG: cell division FtsA domain-containing protein [Candidatus Niyogibacteria bacterium]|nr:cell division FtsA domain-containing protein [Candidatus Niyogibacteria bacterium]